jgi:hypothetical protein
MTKDEILASCKVPEKFRTDKHEPITQEQWIEGIRKAIKVLAVDENDLIEIRDHKLPLGELRSLWSTGYHN